MKHILLTGATGFLGSHLLEALIAEGYKVTILKRSTSDTWRISHLLDLVTTYDIDLFSIEDLFSVNSFDVVIHTACHYGREGQRSSEVVGVNLLLSIQLLELAVFHGVGSFINTDTLLQKDKNAYSLSKNQFRGWLKYYSENIEVINIKLEHMYGPKDDERKLVPWLIGQFDRNVKMVPLSKGDQFRDFIYVKDVVFAYIRIIKSLKKNNYYMDLEVGTGNSIPVRKFIEEVHNVYLKYNPNNKTRLGFGEVVVQEKHASNIFVDNSKLKEIGWSCSSDIDINILSCIYPIRKEA